MIGQPRTDLLVAITELCQLQLFVVYVEEPKL